GNEAAGARPGTISELKARGNARDIPVTEVIGPRARRVTKKPPGDDCGLRMCCSPQGGGGMARLILEPRPFALRAAGSAVRLTQIVPDNLLNPARVACGVRSPAGLHQPTKKPPKGGLFAGLVEAGGIEPPSEDAPSSNLHV